MDNHPYSSLAQSVERMTVNHDVVGSSPTGGAKQRPRFGEVFCLSRPASGQGGIAPPVGLNQTTSRFENVTPVALLTERKRFQDAIGTPGAPFQLSLFARASGANHRCRWGLVFRCAGWDEIAPRWAQPNDNTIRKRNARRPFFLVIFVEKLKIFLKLAKDS